MAIDKKLIFWKKQSTFNAPSSTTDTTGSVMWYSIVFFKDTGKIWTNGTYYNCTDDWESITNKPSTFTPSEHNHDGLTPFVAGTQLAATGSWTGIASSVDALYDGLTINYWLPYAGSGNATLNLTLKGGGTTGAINCYYSGTSRLTTHYGAGNIIKLTYRINANVNGTAYTGWWADANYDTSDNYTHRYYGAFKMGSAAVAANNIIGSGADGLMVNVMTTPFKPHEPIYWTGSAYSANQAVTYGNVYESHFSCSISGTGVTSLVMYQPIYLKGTINNGLFTTNSITQTTPTTDDGFYYIFIGYPWNTTNSIGFSFKNWLGVYKNGAFRIFSGYSELTGKLANSVNITVGDSTKSFDGASALAFTLAEIGAAAINQTMYIGTTAVPINRSSGALSLSGVSIDGNAATATTSTQIAKTVGITDANSAYSDGFLKYYAQVTSPFTNQFPTTNNANGILWVSTHPGSYGHQLGFSSNGEIYRRTNTGTAWTSWKTILDSGNSNLSTVDWSAKNLNISGQAITPTYFQVTTNSGYIQIGPQNSSYCHIYTDRPSFYYNKDISINGNKVWHAGDFNPAKLVYFNGVSTRFSGDVNTLGLSTTSGVYNISTATNLPSGTSYGTILAFFNTDISTQLYIPYNGNGISWRKSVGNTYTGSVWRTLLDSDNTSWGTASGSDQPLTINGTTKTLSLSSHTHSYLPLSGGTLIYGGKIEGNGNITIRQTSNGGNATGLWWKKIAETENIAGIGALTTNGELETLFLGWGASPWVNSNNLSLSSKSFKYKGNTIWHAGNDGAGSGLDADLLDGLHAKYNGGGSEAWGYIPVVAADGTMQVGRYLDFNHSSGIGVDYNARLHTNGVTDGELYINSNRIWHAGNLNLSTYFTYRGSFTSSSNANNMTDMGMWLNTTGNGSGNSNFPAQYGYIQTFSRGIENYSRWQMSVDNTADNIHIRAEWAGVWGGWKKLWHSANDGSGSGLDADLLDGVQASGFTRSDQDPIIDLNTVNGSGIMCNPYDVNATLARNYPIAQAGTLFYGTAAYSSANQIYGSYSSNRWFARGGGSGINSKTSWKEFAFISDLGAYLPLSGGTLTGSLTGTTASFSGGVSAARLAAGYDSGVAGAVSCNNWFRSSGATGWYNQTYYGGIYMTDETYVRVYNSKAFKVDSTANNSILTAGGVMAGGNIYIDNNKTYFQKLTNGSYYTLIKYGDDDVCYISQNGSNVAIRSNNSTTITTNSSTFTIGSALVSSTVNIQAPRLNGNLNGDIVKTNPQLAAGLENNEITIVNNANSAITTNSPGSLTAIRNAINFRWYATNWQIGNLRDGSNGTAGFGITYGASALYFRVTSSATYVYGNLSVSGSGTFTGGGFNSLRELKNIHEDWKGNAIDTISQFKVRDFNYKNQSNINRTLGFIIDEIPSGIAEYVLMGEKKDSVNLYSLHALSFKAHQETKSEIDLLKLRIQELETKIKILENGVR